MRNIMLIMEYDGTKYNGWQRQGNTDKTIQTKLELLLSKMTGAEVQLIASGRTDAGVHAYNQVANFFTESEMPLQKMAKYINSFLPSDIKIKSVQEADLRFHSRLSVKSKTYLYRISNNATVFDRNYVYEYDNTLDLQLMRRAAEYFVGKHDFLSFCSLKRTKKSTVRCIFDISIENSQNETKIYIKANGFLYNMVRIMVGTLLKVGTGELPPEEIVTILEKKDRQYACETAPPHGLYLYEVVY